MSRDCHSITLLSLSSTCSGLQAKLGGANKPKLPSIPVPFLLTNPQPLHRQQILTSSKPSMAANSSGGCSAPPHDPDEWGANCWNCHIYYIRRSDVTTEGINQYHRGSFHPVLLGDLLGDNGRFRVVHKLGAGGRKGVRSR